MNGGHHRDAQSGLRTRTLNSPHDPLNLFGAQKKTVRRGALFVFESCRTHVASVANKINSVYGPPPSLPRRSRMGRRPSPNGLPGFSNYSQSPCLARFRHLQVLGGLSGDVEVKQKVMLVKKNIDSNHGK